MIDSILIILSIFFLCAFLFFYKKNCQLEKKIKNLFKLLRDQRDLSHFYMSHIDDILIKDLTKISPKTNFECGFRLIKYNFSSEVVYVKKSDNQIFFDILNAFFEYGDIKKKSLMFLKMIYKYYHNEPYSDKIDEKKSKTKSIFFEEYLEQNGKNPHTDCGNFYLYLSPDFYCLSNGCDIIFKNTFSMKRLQQIDYKFNFRVIPFANAERKYDFYEVFILYDDIVYWLSKENDSLIKMTKFVS